MGNTASALVGNRYEIYEKLGEGAMGVVYRGIDVQSGVSVAVKSLKSDIPDPVTIQRFIREGEALRQLNHPNIVKLLDAIQEGNSYYLVMELVSGGSLRDNLNRVAQMPIEQVIMIGLDLADALTRAHRLHIIHRDLKPGNVLLADNGTPRLTDFGIARTLDSNLTETGAVVGTVGYLSPEALRGDEPTPQLDIWAFGVMLFEMLCGTYPFHAETLGKLVVAILNDPIPDLELLRPDSPIALVDLIYRMLAKNPAERIPSVRLVGAELEAILQGRAPVSSQAARRVEGESPGRISSNLFDFPSSSVHRPKHNLPLQSTPFVGREQELEQLDQLIAAPAARLVTITAPGGMGKTRLALETCARHLRSFSDGVYLVDLAPLDSAEHIPNTLFSTFNLSFTQGQRSQEQQLLDYFREKNMLLLLDNFEHVLAGKTWVDAILKNAPALKILVTSRERLSLTGETVFSLGGMEFPDWETPVDALEYAAVQLFMQSGKRSLPAFELKTDDLNYVAHICRLVGGTPLGILLAAAWVDTLSLEEIATEISRNFDFLEVHMSDLPERQRSIRAAFEYSWALLNPPEREILMKLSVFRGGMTRHAVQTMTGATLGQLQALVNKSLLRRNVETGRYELHELLRQYVEEALTESGAAMTTHDTHSAYFAAAVQLWEAALKGRRSFEALQEIDGDLENVRAAWQWAIDQQQYQHVEQMLNGMWYYFFMKMASTDGADFFSKALVLNSDRALLGKIKARYGDNVASMWHYEESEPELQTSLTIAQEYNNPFEIAFCLTSLGLLLFDHTQDFEKAGIMIAEAIRIFEKLHEPWLVGRALVAQFYITAESDETDILKTQRLIEAARSLYQAIGNQWGAINTLSNIGIIYQAMGDYDTANALFKEKLATAYRLKTIGWTLHSLSQLGYTAWIQGDYEAALRHSEALTRNAREVGDFIFATYGMIIELLVVIVKGQQHEALNLFEAINTSMPPYIASPLQPTLLHAKLWIAYMHGEIDRGLGIGKEALLLLEQPQMQVDIAEMLFLMALLELQGGHQDAAQIDLRQGLPRITSARQKLLSIYVGAELMYSLGKLEKAVEWAAFAANHRALDYVFRVKAQALLGQLETELSTETFAAVISSGNGLDLDTTVEALLEEVTED